MSFPSLNWQKAASLWGGFFFARERLTACGKILGQARGLSQWLRKLSILRGGTSVLACHSGTK
jgi:hypothetical protein